ncbi:MAG: hypothetical protein QG658_275 [Patescibacteria group bacterium]|nr:hypothetical protein [Patescibacteria group bacterium]
MCSYLGKKYSSGDTVEKAQENEIIEGMREASYKQLGLYISVTIFALILSFSVVAFLLFATSPRDIGALGVTLWFIALFICATSAILLVRYNLGRRRHPEIQERFLVYRRSLRGSAVMGLFLAIGLAMQSLRMLNLGDILLFLLTLAIIELYFRTKKS